MHPTPRNLLYIRQLDRRGFPAEVIYRRCQERLVWDGPLPSVADILAITKSPARGLATEGPADCGDNAGPSTQPKER